MNVFTASNGITLRITDDPYLDFGPHPTSPVWLKPEELVALREFFRAEEDERLGLWRSKADPTWTAVRRNTMVYLHNDDHERSFHFLIGNEATLKAWTWDLQQIAKEYMDAHPEPKPWHDAKPGEVWVLTCDDEVLGGAYVAGDHTFVAADHGLPINSSRITAGRRIYPEVTS